MKNMKINSLSTKKHYNIPKTLSQTESAQISSENVINKKNVRFFQKETDKLNANIEKKISKLQKINMNRNSIESNNLSQDYTNLQELKDLDGWVNQIQTPKDGLIDFKGFVHVKPKINNAKRFCIYRKSQPIQHTEIIFPELRQKILNSIFHDEEDKNEKNNEVLQKSDKGFGRTIGQSFKSMETKKMEINENLINELLFKKIQKKIAVLNNPKNLDIKNNTIINETVYNFKSLQNLFKMRSPINYENLLQKLNIESKEISKIFDFSKEVRKINDDKKDIDLIEPIFLGDFKELQEIIKSKKNIEKKLRLQINNSHKKLMSEKTYLEQLQTKFQINTEIKVEKIKSPKTIPNFLFDNKKEEIQEFVKFNKLQEDRKKAIDEELMEINRIKDQMLLNKESLTKVESEIRILRKQKTYISLKLKDLYFKKLKEGSSESLVWIIKAFWNLEEELSKEFFPSFLDSENIQYLFEMAALEKKLDAIKMLNFLNNENIKSNFSVEETAININGKFLSDKNGMIERLKNIAKTTKVSASNKKNIMTNNMRERIQSEDPDQTEKNDQNNSKYNADGLYEMVVKHKHLENEIKDILDQISLLVKNETDRVFDFFSETVLDENHLQKLKNILKSLFGTKESEKKLELFLKFSNENKNVCKNKLLEQKKTNEEGKIKNINSRRAKTDIDASYMNRFDKKLFLNGDQNSVNYNYNVSYNYHPNLQNLTIESTYYKEN